MSGGRLARVPRRLWGDPRWRGLPPEAPSARALLWRLATGPEPSPVPGLVLVHLGGLADALGWPRDATEACARDLEAAGLLVADWSAGVAWLPWALEWAPPGSLAVVVAWAQGLEDAPPCVPVELARAAAAAVCAGRGPAWQAAWQAAGLPERQAAPQADQLAEALAAREAEPLPAPRARPRETRIQTDPVCGSDLRPRSRISEPPFVGLPKALTEIARAAPAADPHGSAVRTSDAPPSREDALGRAFQVSDGGRVPPATESPPAGQPEATARPRPSDPFRESLTAVADELPADWQPDPEAETLARSLGLDPVAELGEYRAWCAAQGRRSAAWQADYLLWLRRSAKFARERARRSGGPRRPPALDAHPPGAGWIDTLSRHRGGAR